MRFPGARGRGAWKATSVGHGERWPRKVLSALVSGERLDVPRGTIEFTSATCEGVDLSGQTFDNYAARGSLFTGCDFSRAVWGGGVLGDLPPTTYRDCDFSGADLRRAGPQFARFERCRFVDTRLHDWTALCAEFVECLFVGRLLRVKFSGQPWGFARERILPIRKENAFQGNDFRYAELEDCSIAGGINLDANLWPERAPYVIVRSAHDRIARAMTRLDELPEGPVRNRAAARLQVYAYGCWPLQTDMLLRRDELGPAAALLLYDQAATER